MRGLLALLTSKPGLSTQQRAAAVHPLMGSLPLPVSLSSWPCNHRSRSAPGPAAPMAVPVPCAQQQAGGACLHLPVSMGHIWPDITGGLCDAWWCLCSVRHPRRSDFGVMGAAACSDRSELCEHVGGVLGVDASAEAGGVAYAECLHPLQRHLAGSPGPPQPLRAGRSHPAQWRRRHGRAVVNWI